MYLSMFFGSFLYKGASHLNMLCGQLSSNPRKPRSSHPCAYVVHVFAMRCSACGVRLSPVTHTHSIGVMFSCDVIDARCLKQKVTISCIEKVSPCWRVRNFSCDCDFSSFFLKFQEKLWEISSWRDPETYLISEELMRVWCKFLLNVYIIDCAIDDDGECHHRFPVMLRSWVILKCWTRTQTPSCPPLPPTGRRY